MDRWSTNARLFRLDLMAKIPLPPNQQLVAPGKWPCVGEKAPDPRRRAQPWRVAISGLVSQPKVWMLEDLQALPHAERRIDIHCVTRWSKLDAHFSGIPLRKLLEQCDLLPRARFLSFVARSERQHSTSLPIETALALDVLIGLSYEGQSLAETHGGPVRTVVPGRYFYKSVKWLETICVLEDDQLGYWEKEAGYHNDADPWKEERYIVATIDNATYRELIARRNFSGKNLLGMRADGRNLSGLDARGAQLRDAHFERSILTDACFDGANLSNAHFEGANLRGATFRNDGVQNADLEGADFRGADLRGVDFTGASLFGATLCPVDQPTSDPYGPAAIDHTTKMDRESIERLTPVQYEFLLTYVSG